MECKFSTGERMTGQGEMVETARSQQHGFPANNLRNCGEDTD